MNQPIYGLRAFLFETLSLISKGEHELISDIEKHIQNGDIVCYINNKYKCDMNPDTYEMIEQYYKKQWSGCAEGAEDRRYGLQNENDGLLLIVALALNDVY